MDCWDSYALIFTKTTKWRGNWPIIELAAQKTGLSGAFINLFRLPVDNFASGSIDLFYFDESGFTLEPCVPYA